MASRKLDQRRQADAIAASQAAGAPASAGHLSPEAIQATLHELRVHQIELEMQNEELRLAQADLDVTRAPGAPRWQAHRPPGWRRWRPPGGAGQVAGWPWCGLL